MKNTNTSLSDNKKFQDIFSNIFNRPVSFGWVLLLVFIATYVVTWQWQAGMLSGGFVFCLGLFLLYDCAAETYNKSWYPTIGMLGTFIGIAIGLYKFDPTSPSDTLPVLLEGLKLAFITSIAGVAYSVVRAVLAKINLFKITEKTEYDQLEQMNTNFDVFIKRIGKSFGAQLQEGLAEALNNLTEDISSKFTESIDNFTLSVNKLSEKIDSLASIQDEYDAQMDKMTMVADRTTTLLTNISDNIENLSKPLEAIKELAESTTEAVEDLKDLPETISSVNRLADTTTSSIRNMSSEYSASVKQFFDRIKDVHNTQCIDVGNYAAGIVKKLAENFEEVNDALDKAATILPDSIARLDKRIDEVAKANKKTSK